MDQFIEQQATQAQIGVRKFPVPGTNLARILSDVEYRQTFHGQLKRYNPFIVAFYKVGLLPLFGMSRNVMLLTTRGRKSGRLRNTPIGYFRISGVIHLFSAWGKCSSWYQNMLANPNDVWIQIGLRRFPVKIQTLEEPVEIQDCLRHFIGESPVEAHSVFGWDPDLDRIDQADFSQIIHQVLIVRFTEKKR